MNAEQAEILNRLFEDGYIIQIECGAYVTGNVTMIENPGLEGKGVCEWQYSDEHVQERPLSEVYLNEVKVMARVDWLNIIGDDINKFTPISGDLPSLQDWNEDLDNAYDEAGD